LALALPQLGILTVDLWICRTLQYFQAIGTYVCHDTERSASTMSAVDQLISYIKSLSPEQARKAVSHLPQLTAILEGQEQSCLEILSERNQSTSYGLQSIRHP